MRTFDVEVKFVDMEKNAKGEGTLSVFLLTLEDESKGSKWD